MSDVISSVLKKNGTDLFMVTNSSIVKLVPVSRISKIEDEVNRIRESCDENNPEDIRSKLDHLVKIDSVLKAKGSLIYGGILYQVNSIIPNKIFDEKVSTVVKRKVKEEQEKKPDTKAPEILYKLHLDLLNSGSTDKTIGYPEYMKERIYFTIARTARDMQPSVYCAKYIPSFMLRYTGVSVKGVWEFPSLVIGTKVIDTRTQASDEIILSYEPYAVVLEPIPYKHPYVFFHDNTICLGTFASSTQINEIRLQPIIPSLFKFMCQVENIITNGYYENSGPANGHLNAPHFRGYKRFNSIDEEEPILIQKTIERVKSDLNAARTSHEAHQSGSRLSMGF